MNKKIVALMLLTLAICLPACGKNPATETTLSTTQAFETELSTQPLETEQTTQPTEDENTVYEDDFIKVIITDITIDDALGGTINVTCTAENKSNVEISVWIENICVNGNPTKYISDSFGLNTGETVEFSFVFLNEFGFKRVCDIDEVVFTLDVDNATEYTDIEEAEVSFFGK